MAAAGDAIFSNLGLLFAVGVGVGLARENHGAAGLAALVGFLVTTHAVEVLLAAAPGSLAKLSIPIGLCPASSPASGYNRFGNITLPSYLSFFGGRRFVPIVSGLAGLVLAAVVGYAWPFLERGMDATSHAIWARVRWALFAYGVLNRILIVTGLHHILNNFAWFILRRLPRRHGRSEAILRRRPNRGRVHVRLLSGHDVRVCRGRASPCITQLRQSVAPASRACCCRWA